MSGPDNNCAVCGLPLDDHWLATCPENADCANPVTWDGEPVYSPATVAEGLFDGGAFEQMKGQVAMPEPFPYELRRFAHVVGRDTNKYHLVAPGADAALCGAAVSGFNTTLAAGYERQVLDGGLVCLRCEARS